MNRETIEEAAEKIYQKGLQDDIDLSFYDGVRLGAKWQAERMYSEEYIRIMLRELSSDLYEIDPLHSLEEWFEQYKKGFSGYPNTENWKELPFNEWFKQFKKK